MIVRETNSGEKAEDNKWHSDTERKRVQPEFEREWKLCKTAADIVTENQQKYVVREIQSGQKDEDGIGHCYTKPKPEQFEVDRYWSDCRRQKGL